jgi:hypothetical protein
MMVMALEQNVLTVIAIPMTAFVLTEALIQTVVQVLNVPQAILVLITIPNNVL